MNDYPVCSRCAQRGQTCCQLKPGEEEFCFPLSEGEMALILEAAQTAGHNGLFLRQVNSPDFIARLERLFPDEGEAIGRLFPLDGWHWRLATDSSGRCALLTGQGCLLPFKNRPLFCRIFPFWQTGGQLHIFAHENCQAWLGSRTAAEMLAALDTSLEQLSALGRQLRQAWGLALSH